MNPIQSDRAMTFHRIPHFESRNGKLHFLGSPRIFQTLSKDEEILWNLLKSPKTWNVISQTFGKDARGMVERLKSLGVIVEIQPKRSKKGGPILVLEPHHDDAALSLGAWLLARRKRPLRILTATSRYISTTLLETGRRRVLSVEQVSELRSTEGRLAGRILGAASTSLPHPDAPLRYCRNPEKLHRVSEERFSGEYERSISENLLRNSKTEAIELARQILRRMTADSTTLLAPMGIGAHPDHLWVRNAALSLLLDSKVPEVGLYEDQPYAMTRPGHRSRLIQALTESGLRVRVEESKVGSRHRAKRNLLCVYASQWKIDSITDQLGLGPESIERIVWVRRGKSQQPTSDLGTLLEHLLELELEKIVGSDPMAWLEQLGRDQEIQIYLFHDLRYAKTLAHHPLLESTGNKIRFHIMGTKPIVGTQTQFHESETDMMLSVEQSTANHPVVVISNAYRLWENLSELGLRAGSLLAARNAGDLLKLFTFRENRERPKP